MSDTTPGAEPTPEPNAPEGSAPDPAASPAASPSASPSASPDYAAQAKQAADTLKAGNPLDLGIIGAGLVAFVASLLPFYTVSVDIIGISRSDSVTAWHGFFGWFGVLAALAAAALLVLKLLGIAVPVPVRTAVLALFGLALVCTILALFVFPGGGCDDAGLGVCDAIDTGHGFGYWLTLLATIAGTGLAFVRRSAD